MTSTWHIGLRKRTEKICGVKLWREYTTRATTH